MMLKNLRGQLRDKSVLAEWLRGGGGVPSTSSNIIIEYSSPNVAKPFHAGHLRSTILGHFLCGLHRRAELNVTSINFLGDWGTQFGILARGLRDQPLNSLDWESSPKEAIRQLHNVYVASSKRAEDDPSYREEAKRLFSSMERGDAESLQVWQRIRDVSVEEFRRLYRIIGVSFDRWEAESNFMQENSFILKRLSDRGVLVEKDGAQGVLGPAQKGSDQRQFIVLAKQDNSSLYLSRDIAQILSRMKMFKPKKIHYVVDVAQINHFQQLKTVLELLGEDAAAEALNHVIFGRIQGMSSRRGTSLLLEDMLDRVSENATKIISDSPTCRVAADELPAAAQKLALAGLLVNDLRKNRRADYSWDWDAILKTTNKKGSILPTGAQLQYRHARLTTLIRGSREKLGLSTNAAEDDLDNFILIDEEPSVYLSESEAQKLIQHFATFPSVLAESFNSLQSRVIADFAFEICRLTGRATKFLKIIDNSETSDSSKVCRKTALHRLLLFQTAKDYLSTCMELLCLEPMDEM